MQRVTSVALHPCVLAPVRLHQYCFSDVAEAVIVWQTDYIGATKFPIAFIWSNMIRK